MAASGKKLDLEEVARAELIPAYLKALKTGLGNIDASIIDANVIKVVKSDGSGKKDWANFAELEREGYFDKNGNFHMRKLVQDFPGAVSLIKRFKIAMDAYFSESKLTNQDKFLLFCANFKAASDVNKILVKHNNQNLNILFDAIQGQIMRHVSQGTLPEEKGKLESMQEALVDFEIAGAQSKLARMAKMGSDFVPALNKQLQGFTKYQGHYVQKEQKAEVGKLKAKEKEAKESSLTDLEISQVASITVAGSDKNQVVIAVREAINKYKLNHNLLQLARTIHTLLEDERNRIKAQEGGKSVVEKLFAKHPLLSRLEGLNKVIKKELGQRPFFPEPESPTAAPESDVEESSRTSFSSLDSDDKKEDSTSPRPG